MATVSVPTHIPGKAAPPRKAAAATSAAATLWIPAYSLWRRELVRFYRQKARVVGVIASPLLFWLVLGSGFSKTFQSHGSRGAMSSQYLSYFFPGAIIMIVLFTAIFSMMSLIQDRNEGFLLSVLAAPIRRSAIVLGKVLGGATLAAIQGWIFLVFSPLAGVHTGALGNSVQSADHCADFILVDGPGVHDRLADGFDAGVSCRHQPDPDPAVAALGSAFSGERRFRVAAMGDDLQSADLRRGRAAQWTFSGGGDDLFSRGESDRHADILRGGFCGIVGDCEPSHEQAGRLGPRPGEIRSSFAPLRMTYPGEESGNQECR